MGEGRERQLGARGLSARQELAALARRSPCTECGRLPSGRSYVSHHGEATCASHRLRVRCAFCSRPSEAAGPGWADLGRSVLRCPRCADSAVDDLHDVRRVLPRVRAEIATLGFALDQRVKVQLLSAAELFQLLPEGGPAMFGLTRVARWTNGQTEVIDLAVLRGLPEVWFGRTIAHENMHAWMAQRGIRTTSVIEEGLCEVAAFGWLALQPDPFSATLRELMRTSTDPVYGVGLHQVQASIAAIGIHPTIEHLRRTGNLPRVDGA